MSLQTRLGALITAIGADIKALYAGKVDANDSRLSDAREWTAETVSQVEAEAGTATTRRAWTAQRVRQAIAAWWASVKDNLSSIGVNGDIEIKGSGRRIRGDFGNSTVSGRVMFQTSTENGNTVVEAIPNGNGSMASFAVSNSYNPDNASFASIFINHDEMRIQSLARGSGTYLPMGFYVAGAERMRIDMSGNVLVTSPACLGYGAGAGGSVTQTTSKATAVTLNKPTGRIVMHNEVLDAGATTLFFLHNSLIGDFDVVVVNVWGNGSYKVSVRTSSSGLAFIELTNVNSVSLAEVVHINFDVFRCSGL